MRVVALHTDFRLYWPARLKKLSSDLEERGDELIVIEISGKGSPYSFASKSTNEELNWICLFPEERMENISPKVAKVAVLEKLDELMPDAILAGAIAFPSGAAAVDWAKKNNKAAVIFDDSKLNDVPRNFIVNTVKRIIYSNVDAILCPAEDWIPTYEYWGFKKEAIFFGVDVVDNSFWRTKSNLNQNLPKRYLLLVGRQIKCKNFETVLFAFISFHESTPNANLELILVGEGPERDNLKAIVPKHLISKIHFLPFQSQEEVRELYQQSLAVILSSKSETWGLVVNEAMAAGSPIIVSRQCGCASTLVQDDVNGFTFDASDTNRLTNILIKIDQFSDQRIEEMSQKSKEIISYWDLDRFSKGTIDAIHYAVNNKRKPFYRMVRLLLEKWSGRYNPI